MKCLRLIILIFFLWNGSAKAQQAARFLTSFPFEELYGGVILIHAQVGSAPDTLNFILDTGSGSISIDSATAAYCGLTIHETNDSISGIGGTRRVNRVYDAPLRFPGLTVPHLDFNVNHYETLSASYGIRVDGIIGYAFLSKYILDVNFDQMRISVYTQGRFDYPRKSYTWRYRLAFLASTFLHVRDHKSVTSQYYIDTGAGLSMLFTEDFIRDSGLLSSRKRPVVTQVDGMAGKTTVRLTTVRELKLGPYKFRNVPAYIYPDKDNVLTYPAATGLIGNDILRRFNWILDYSKKEMNLLPNKNFNDDFDYAYTGLGIYLVDSAVTITDVIKDSPAEKAGFRIGDIIFSVDNILSTGFNVAQLKTALQAPRKSLHVIIIRNGELTDMELRPESILN